MRFLIFEDKNAEVNSNLAFTLFFSSKIKTRKRVLFLNLRGRTPPLNASMFFLIAIFDPLLLDCAQTSNFQRSANYNSKARPSAALKGGKETLASIADLVPTPCSI